MYQAVAKEQRFSPPFGASVVAVIGGIEKNPDLTLSLMHRGRATKPPTWVYAEASGRADVCSRQSEHHTQHVQG